MDDLTVYGGSYVAEIFVKHNIKFVFTLTGGHIAPILIASNKMGIKIIDVRQEVTTVFAADAVSRLTDTVGVAVVTAGPGITNTVTAVKNAQMAQSPVVILGGATSRLLKGKGSLQDIDQIAIMKPIVKWYTTIKSYNDLSKINEAFYKAQEGVPGPVFVECPIDILWPLETVRQSYSVGSKYIGNSIKGKVIKWYLNRYIRKIFKGASYFSAPEPKPVLKKIMNPKTMLKAVTIFEQAEKPLMLIGSQAVNNLILIEQLLKAIEKFNIPVYLSGMARGLLGINHPLQFRHKRKIALKEADLIILAGIPVDFRLDYGRAFNKHAKSISVNLDKNDLSKNYRPSVKSRTHPGEFLIELSKKVSYTNSNRKKWFKSLQDREKERNTEIMEKSKEKMDRINPLYLSYEIDTFLPENSILIGDGGDIIATISYIVQPRKPLSWLDPGPFGTLGAGAGFALAAKLIHPDKDIILLYGDGSFGYSLPEWDTFIRHKIPIIGIIGNDSGWMQVAREQVAIFEDSIGTELGDRFYDKVVEGFGVKGFLVKKSNEIRPILEQAKHISKEGLPVLINVLIGRSNFRKGSISM